MVTIYYSKKYSLKPANVTGTEGRAWRPDASFQLSWERRGQHFVLPETMRAAHVEHLSTRETHLRLPVQGFIGGQSQGHGAPTWLTSFSF